MRNGQPIRVAHVIAGLGFGGAERNLVNLLNALDCEYKAVILIGAPRTTPSLEGDLNLTVNVARVRVRRRSLLFGLLRLAKVIRNSGVNIVHTHMFQSNLYGSIAALFARTPGIVTTEHGENPWKNCFHRIVERQLISRIADVRFCVSPRILEIRRDVDRIPASKLRLISNGTVIPDFEYRGSGDDVPIIGSVGRLIDAKDYPVLLEAVALLKARGYSFHLRVAGDGPEREKLERKIADLGIADSVSLLGLVTDTVDFFKCCDVYVTSSKREGLPIALLEAMSFGLPTVATDVGAMAEVVQHEVGGLIVPPASPESLADAIARILDNDALRMTLSRGGRARVESSYSVDSVARSHEKVYSEILADKFEL